MKKLVSCSMIVSVALVSAAFAGGPDKDAVMAREKAAWQAFKDKKPDDFKKIISSDLVAVYDMGMMNMQAEVEMMKKADLRSFEFSDFNMTAVGDDIIMVTYKCKVDESVDGKDISGTYNCGSVWKKKGNDWWGIFHSDMKAADSAK